MTEVVRPEEMEMINQFTKEVDRDKCADSGSRKLAGGFAEVVLVTVDEADITLSFREGHQFLPDPGPESEAEYEESIHVCKIPRSLITRQDMTLADKIDQTRTLPWKQTKFYSQQWTITTREYGVKERRTITDVHTYEWPAEGDYGVAESGGKDDRPGQAEEPLEDDTFYAKQTGGSGTIGMVP
jgi:hypothetical protein